MARSKFDVRALTSRTADRLIDAMELNNIAFADHDSCEALSASILDLPPALRREKNILLRTDQILWLPADPPEHVYLLSSGRVEITETNRAGRSTLLQVIRPGEIFGYLCFCDHRAEPHGTEARATAAGAVRRTSYLEFSAALRRNASVAARLTEALCLRISEAERRIRVLTIHDAKKRLAALLHQLAIAKLAESKTRSAIVSVYTSHAELAARASLTRPHTTVLMTRFRSLGCVSYERGTAIKVHLKNIQALL